MEFKGLKKASFRIVLYALFLSAICTVFAFQDSHAKCSEPSCSALESTGATSDTCDRVSCCSNGNLQGWRYGAVFFTGGWSNENDWPTWDGSSSLDFTVRGAVFCCQTTNNNAYVSANSISFSDSISLNGSSLERSCSGDKSWGPVSSDYLKATVPASTLDKASCDSGNPATCSYTVSVTSTLGSGSAATYSSYFKFYKQKRETATFAKNGISVSSTSMSKSGTTFSGDGKSTKYKVSVTYNIKRTNSTPSSATSNYGAKVSENSASYPSSSSATTSALSNGGNYPISVDYDLDMPNGTTKTYCFNIKFDSEVLYLQGSRDSGNFSGTDSACYTFYNPAKNETHFSGAISASGSAGLTVDNANNTAKGNGLRNDFSLTPTYTITRLATDGNPSSASSDYNFAAATSNNDAYYPSSSAYNTGGLAKGGSKTNTASASSITLNIGSTTTQCFYLRYDSYVLYYDSTRDSGNFAGYTKKCFSVTNPPAYYTATFGGTVNGTAKATTSGTLDAHDNLTRTDSNHMGVINHTSRKTGRTDYENGRFNESAYPSSSNYTATFTHTVTRTDTKPADTVNNVYATSAQTAWQVQYSLNGGNWTNYTTSDDNSGSSATVSGTDALTDGATKTITVHPKWTMNATNAGRYIYYCQRLSYKSSSTYKTASEGSGYKTVFDSYGADAYTTAACVTLRNPLWTESQKGSNKVHNISITGATTGITPTGARLRSAANTTAYETTAVGASFAFDHSLTRTDSGFDESDIGRSDFETSVNPAFFHPSIYSNCNYAVTTKMWGNERMPGTRSSYSLIYPKRAAEGTACNGTTKLNPGANGGLVNGYEVQLNATSKTDTSTNRWFSSASNGRTTTSFHADASNTNDYLLLAGQTKQFSQSTYNSNGANWTVSYKDLVRCETYTSGYFIGTYPTKNPASDCKYDRTEVIDTAPQETTPIYYDSSYTTYSLFRPYNYNISDLRPVSTPSSDITYAGQNVKRSFTVSINRQDSTKSYITDLYSPDVYVIGFRILPNQNRTNIENATVGAAGLTNTGNAQTDLCTNFYGASNRIGFGSDTSRCSILSGHTAKLGTKDGRNAYNHVYGFDNSTMSYDYSLSYTTNDIYVPNNLAVGEKYCIAIAVANSTTNPSTGLADSSYYLSKSSCSNIAKLPSVHVWSGSVRTNGGIKTSTSYALQSNRTYLTYGSWADFAIIANGKVAKMSSAASIARGTTHTTLQTILCNTDHLTIANSQCAGTGQVTALGGSKVISDSTTLAKLKGRYVEGRAESTLIQQDTITASDFAAHGLDAGSFYSNHPLVVYSSSNLIVSTNIISTENRAFSQNFTPQVILLAEGDIKIDQSVTRLDAWIIAGGEVDTCTNGNDPISLHSNVCTNQLTVKGAILAQKISLKRTYGGDTNVGQANTPAELIQFTPSLLLFTARESERSLLPETTYLHELPVRY